MSPYKIKASCKQHNWRSFKQCELGISPGNAYHEGQKLESILAWATEHFDHCLLTLSDTMYRHNFMAQGLSADSALIASEKLGQNWLAQNQSALMPYLEKIKIKHWNEWLHHPDFEKTHNELMKYIAKSYDLKQALNLDIQSFMARKIRQGQMPDLVKMRYHSFNLITEEISCYILIGRSGSYARAYPSHDMHSFAFMRRPQTPVSLKGFENITHIELTLNRRAAPLQVAA